MGEEVLQIAPEEVERKQKSVVLIDVREPAEYAQGHIAGAILIPLGELEERFAEIPKDQEVVMICRSGRRSEAACQFLGEQGYTNAANMTGGMLAWSGDVEV